MKDRRKWFEKPGATTPYPVMTVLWWVPVGHLPTVDEARERLEYLNAHGLGPTAFTLRETWPKPALTDSTSSALIPLTGN